MGRELQKKKRRSGRAPVRQPNRTKKILNPRGNSTIAKNWDMKQTLSQNYRRLGLLARLKAPTGGTEKKLEAARTKPSATTPFVIPTTDKAILSEARVERDAEGNIVRILSSTAANPLRDPLNELDSDGEKDEDEDEDQDQDNEEDGEEWAGIDATKTDVVRSLEEEAKNAAPPKERHQSEQEREWLGRLVQRHGEDYGAMARDGRLNPMQQTAADLKRRVRKMGL